jgi:two-component system response regulator PilR (NtrC family)
MNPGIDVLVVDDEPVVCDAIRLVLGHEGLSVAAVPDAEAALEHPALGDCRLVICDLMLPGRSGLEVLRAMRERRPGLPIVMITGFATPANADLVLAAGATAFLPKPFDESELLTLVRHVLAPMDVAREERSP